MKGKVLTFGELLLRIVPDAGGQWLKNNQLPFYIGGAELNVATALALWQVPTLYFTALPPNNISFQIVDFLKRKAVDLSRILYKGDRIGVYYLTKGQDLKHDALIYDRNNSAFSELKPHTIDWDKLLDGVSWFHFSAICPGINQNLADICLEGLQAASKNNIVTSIDLNYRSKLWQYGKHPSDVVPNLVQYCDIIMGNVWAAELMLNVKLETDFNPMQQRNIYLKQSKRTSEQMMEKFPKCKVVANTFRFDNEKELKYYTTLFSNKQFYVSKEYSTEHFVDKVGSGDCYMAGLIYGLYNDWDYQKTLEFATAAAFTKLFVKSDATDKSVEDIQNAIQI